MMMPPSPPALSVFSCYAHEDAVLREQFEKHLAMLKRLEWVATWSDRDISAGTQWQQALDHHLQTANLLLLFVSADFLHSDYCYRVEMLEALRRHQAGEARVIPILLRPVEWKQTPLGALQALPRDGCPVTSWTNQDEAFRQIAQEIYTVVEQLRQPVIIVSCLPHQPFSDHLIRDLTNHRIPFWEAEAKQEPSTLREQIRGAAAVVVIASSETEHARMLKETERLLAIYQHPVMRVWVTDEGRNEGRDAFQPPSRHEWIVVDPGQEQHAVQELRTTLQRRRFQGSAQSVHAPQEESVLLQEPRNPYKGLDAFTSADAGDFFGRTTLVDALLTTVQTTLSQEKKGQQPARLLAVVGASGSGKSSVVQAGLLPALQAGKATQSEQWIYLNVIAPKTHPLDELALALLDLFPAKNLNMLREDLKEDSARGLHLYATALARRTGTEHVVLIVDQFEEVFTLTESEQERQQFLDLLVTACTKQDGPLIVILTLRGDFYDRLMQYPTLYKLVAEHLIPMLPMTLPDLRAVITQPATLPDVHLSFEGNLVGDLLFEVQGQIGALPLLQFTLEQLVKQREGHVLTEHAYQQMGGVRGALTKHAEACYQTLPSDEHRQLACTLFLRLLDPGTTEQETTRRRAALTEFAFPDKRQTSVMQETIAAFVRARLLTITANEKTNTITVKACLRTTTTIEVSHEALIRQWPRLVDWLRTARDDIYLQQNISRDAAIWERNTRSSDRLYQGAELKEAQAWAKRNTASRQEHTFLKASAARHLRALLTVIGVILLVATSSGIATWIVLSQHKPDYVTTADDSVIGSLRWAIVNAPSGSIISFAPDLKGHTIILKDGDVHINQQHLTIQSPVTSHIVVQVMGTSIFVNKAVSTTISGITFRGSKTKNGSSVILNEGNLTLKTCSISGNIIDISDFLASSFSGNKSYGGGVYNSGTLMLIDSSVSDNAASRGGGIYNSGNITLANSPISGNTASGFGSEAGGFGSGNGGGIYNSGNITLTNSPISGNTASGFGFEAGGFGSGGGIYNSGSLTLTNGLVSGNTASGSRSGNGSGGGIYNYGDSSHSTNVTLVFCTIVNNSTIDIFNQDPASPMYLKASIVGANSTQNTSIAGAITSGGYNLIQHSSSIHLVSKPQSTDRSVDDLSHVLRPFPVLPNKNNPIQTYQLIPSTNNPAYNAVPKDACTDAAGHPVPTDQRGMPRPGKKKQNCDSGAYESQVST